MYIYIYVCGCVAVLCELICGRVLSGACLHSMLVVLTRAMYSRMHTARTHARMHARTSSLPPHTTTSPMDATSTSTDASLACRGCTHLACMARRAPISTGILD